MASSGWAQEPDVIYYDGKVITVNSEFEIAQAVAITDGKILAVGATDEIRTLATPATKLVDLEGCALLPGFYDNHIHLGGPLQPWKWGGMIDKVPEWLRNANTVPKLKKAIAGQVAQTAKGEWITGDIPREEWPNSTLPTRWDLDEVSPDNPVAIERGPHTILVNSKALELAGVTQDTKVSGGRIMRDPNGTATGVLYENARRVLEGVLPAPVLAGDPQERKLANWHTFLNQLVSLGITSVNVAGVRPDSLQLVETLYERWGDELPRMTVQLRVSPGYDTHDDLEEGVRESIAEIEAIGDPSKFFQHPKLKMGAIKMSIDGGLSAPVFWSIHPYESRPDFHGVVRIPAEAFAKVAERAHVLGWQLGIHTIGDAAVVMVVNELKKILKAHPRADHRHYLHHVSVLPPESTLEDMAKFHINVASQPGFLLALGSYADEALGPELQPTQNPSRSLLDHGIRVSYGSDAGPYGPLTAIFAAVTRTGWNGKVHGPGEAVTIQEAITMQTYEPAYFTFDEKARGSIEPGKVADFVVLDRDPLTIDPKKIPNINVERTIVGGDELYVCTGGSCGCQ